MSDLDKRAAIALSEWLHQTASPGLELAVLPHANEIVAVVLAALGIDDPPEDNDLPPCTCIRTRSGGFVTPIAGPDACPRHVVNAPPDTSSP